MEAQVLLPYLGAAAQIASSVYVVWGSRRMWRQARASEATREQLSREVLAVTRETAETYLANWRAADARLANLEAAFAIFIGFEAPAPAPAPAPPSETIQ